MAEVKEVNYEYLKTWLSPKEIRKIREGNNELNITLTRQQCYNIMKGVSKNFPFREILVRRAMHNEAISTMSNNKS